MKLLNWPSKNKEPTEAELFEKKILETEKLLLVFKYAVDMKKGPIFFKSHNYSKEELWNNPTIPIIEDRISEILSVVNRKLKEGNFYYYHHFKHRIVKLQEEYAQLFIQINKRAPTKLEFWKKLFHDFFGDQEF